MFPRKLLWTCLAFLTAALVACGGGKDTPSTATPSAPDFAPARVDLQTSLDTTYYEVHATTTEAIFDEIEMYGPRDELGQKGSGLTSVVWGYEWTGDRHPDGSCSIRVMTIHADMTVEVPRHSNEAALAPGIRANWLLYAEGVAEHEQRHVEIYVEGANVIIEEMRRIGVKPTCDELEKRIETVWLDQQARINALQEAFHREEEVRLLARRGPIESQIQANRAQLQALQAQVADLDGEISALRAEIQGIDRQAENIDAQIKQINDQFPETLPPTVRDRLNELIAQSNDLLRTYNSRVDAHNSALSRRNDLAQQYDRLLGTTNALVEEYNWSR